jgi:DNA-binding response OmpR family regulator
MAGYPARGDEARHIEGDLPLAASRVVLVITRDSARGGEIVGAIQARDLPAVQATTVRQAVFWTRRAPPALTVLDLSVEGARILLGELRRQGQAVVALSDDPQARTWALEAGCLDAILPTLERDELALKLKGLVHDRRLRRHGTIVAGPLTVDLAARLISWKGEEIIVSPLLLDLAAYLVSHAGQLTPSRVLLEEVWGEPWATSSKVHQAIWRLRHRLREPVGSSFLVGRRGNGYGVFPDASSLASVRSVV